MVADPIRSPAAAGFARSALSGTVWLTACRWTLRGGNLISTIVLARLLTPEDFGLVALAMVLLNLFGVVGSLGFQSAVVQQAEEPDRHEYDVAWTYDSLTQLVVAALLFLSAPLVAAFFAEPRLVPLVQVVALNPALKAAENYTQTVLIRKLEYRTRFVLEASNGIFTLAATLVLAFLWRNAWALVVGYTVGTAARTLISYVLLPQLPRVRFDTAVARRMFGFGRWVVGLSGLRIAREQVDKVLLGRLLGPVSLGFFQVGGRISSQVLADFYQTAHKVLFPIYARMQDDRAGLMSKYRMVVHLMGLIVLPLAVALAALAEPLVRVLFGDRWLPAAPVMQLLALAAFLKILTGTAHPLFRAQGLPRFEFLINALYLVLLIPAVYLFTRAYGLSGAAMGVLAVEVLQLPVWAVALRRVFGLGIGELLSLLAGPVAGSGLAAAAMLWVLAGIDGRSPLLQLTAAAAAGAVAYLLFVALAWRRLEPLGAGALLRAGGRMLPRRMVRA